MCVARLGVRFFGRVLLMDADVDVGVDADVGAGAESWLVMAVAETRGGGERCVVLVVLGEMCLA